MRVLPQLVLSSLGLPFDTTLTTCANTLSSIHFATPPNAPFESTVPGALRNKCLLTLVLYRGNPALDAAARPSRARRRQLSIGTPSLTPPDPLPSGSCCRRLKYTLTFLPFVCLAKLACRLLYPAVSKAVDSMTFMPGLKCSSLHPHPPIIARPSRIS
jgi:hypothetical protein